MATLPPVIFCSFSGNNQLEKHNTKEAYDGSYQINLKFDSKNNCHHLCISLQCYESHSVITGGREQQDEKSETTQV